MYCRLELLPNHYNGVSDSISASQNAALAAIPMDLEALDTPTGDDQGFLSVALAPSAPQWLDDSSAGSDFPAHRKRLDG